MASYQSGCNKWGNCSYNLYIRGFITPLITTREPPSRVPSGSLRSLEFLGGLFVWPSKDSSLGFRV